MGLKYGVVLLPLNSKDVAAEMKKKGLDDKTRVMKLEKQWNVEISKVIKELEDAKSPKLWEEIDKLYELKTPYKDDPEFVEYHEYVHSSDPAIKHIALWGISLPDFPDWTILGYSHIVGWQGLSTKKVFMYIVEKTLATLNMKEFYFVDYHHGSDCGGVVKVTVDKNKIEGFPSMESQYDKFAEDFQKERGVPIKRVHDFFYECHEIEWEFEYYITKERRFDENKKVVK